MHSIYTRLKAYCHFYARLLRLWLLLLLISVSKLSASQDTLYWSPCYRLKLQDFTGVPDSSKIQWANSSIGIGYTYRNQDGKLRYKVFCYFVKTKSWAKNSLSVLIKHEQCHFDIAQLFARKLEKRFNDYFPSNNIDDDLKKIYSGIVKERLDMDNLFDEIEKKHPTSSKFQMKFATSIRNKLPICHKKGD